MASQFAVAMDDDEGEFYIERTSENVAGANADRIYMYQEPLVPRPEDDEESSGEEDEEEED